VRFIAVILFCAIGAFGGEPLRVTVTRVPVQAPVYLAKAERLFQNAGLDVQLVEYEVGKLGLEELTAGKVDVAFAAVTPIVYKCLAGDDFRILANVASSTGMVALMARKDFGITNVAGIAGKTVGLVPGTSGEFFFETLRVLNRLPRSGVKVEKRRVESMLQEFKEGKLDAISIWEPHIEALRDSLTNRVTLFYGDGLYTFSWNMMALPATIQRRRADLEKFMDVLFAAGAEIESDPARAAAELAAKFGPQGKEMTIGLKENRFRPELGQELLVEMEGEARWIINRDLRTNAPPNFLRWFDASILKRAHPSAVTLIQ
jgi:NitT/TauT family transport system substrate-binding protein